MKQTIPALLLALLLAAPACRADAALDAETVADQKVVLTFLNNLKMDNAIYMGVHKIEFFAALAKGQTPKVTLVTCADSRVQTPMFDRTPEGELFTIRNIGNQLATSEGSVEYGVHHLHTPLLIFLGHSRCGAIAAFSGNYSKESPAIKRELDSISISKELNNIEGVQANVNQQVKAAMLKFADEIGAGRLVVIGAVMDFADDLHQGAGKLHLINVNGETDPAKLENLTTLLDKPAAQPAAKAQHKAAAPKTKPETAPKTETAPKQAESAKPAAPRPPNH
jgi:carbonic anhydrase